MAKNDFHSSLFFSNSMYFNFARADNVGKNKTKWHKRKRKVISIKRCSKKVHATDIILS